MKRLLKGNCHLKGHLFKLELVDSPRCNRCKQAIEMTSHVLCNSEAVAVFRLGQLQIRWLCQHIPQQVLHFAQSVGLLNA